MFYLYHHNDLARLAELFGALRGRRSRAPLAIDTVLAPNAGIGRWLRIQLAESEGIAANIDGRLPGEFIWDLLHATMDTAEAGDHFEPACLPWHLYAALPEIAREVPAVADYLGTPVDEVRRYQLAGQLADVFDQYLIYRADMLAGWENGEVPPSNPGRWQARVWHWLTREHRLGTTHRARVLTNFITRLGKDHGLQQRVIAYCPDELYCFGLVALAPDHLRLLYALAEHIDVHFLLPNPSAAYWGDITAGRLPLELPAVATPDDDTLLPGEAAVEAGHPLLSALGRMARDTLRVLYSDEFAGMIEPELGDLMDYDVPPRDTLLHRVQADIVELDCRASPQGMDDADTSFEVHACHSPLREIQVLQDQLLDRLAAEDKRVAAGEIEANDRLAPRDIIVMLPDVAAYAPGHPGGVRRRAGRSLSAVRSCRSRPFGGASDRDLCLRSARSAAVALGGQRTAGSAGRAGRHAALRPVGRRAGHDHRLGRRCRHPLGPGQASSGRTRRRRVRAEQLALRARSPVAGRGPVGRRNPHRRRGALVRSGRRYHRRARQTLAFRGHAGHRRRRIWRNRPRRANGRRG